MRYTFGPSWMPAPISLNSAPCSNTRTLIPLRASASAAARPPMPPPTTSTGRSFAIASPRQQIRPDLGHAARAAQPERALDLVGEDRKRALRPRLARGRRAVERRTADGDRLRAERARLHRI